MNFYTKKKRFAKIYPSDNYCIDCNKAFDNDLYKLCDNCNYLEKNNSNYIEKNNFYFFNINKNKDNN